MMSDAGRRPYIAGNWKMHKTIAETREYVGHLLPRLPVRGGVDVGLCVPFTALAAAVEAAGDSELLVSAQNMHQATEGAYTGEVSAPMLVEVGAPGVRAEHAPGAGGRVPGGGVGAEAGGGGGTRRRARSLGAPPVLLRDRPGPDGQGARRARRRPRADPLRGRERGGARAGRDA